MKRYKKIIFLVSVIIGSIALIIFFYPTDFEQSEPNIPLPTSSPVALAINQEASPTSSTISIPISPISPLISPVLPTPTGLDVDEDSPNIAIQYFWRGDDLYGKGNYDEAISSYNEAIALVPGFSDIYNNRGLAYLQLKKYEEAIADFSTAIELGNNSEPELPYFNRGLAYFAQNEFALAIDDFTEAIIINPDFPQVYNSRAVALSEQGQHELAIADYTSAIELDNKFAAPYFGRGITYKRLEDKQKAVEDFETFIELAADPAMIQQAQEHLESLGITK